MPPSHKTDTDTWINRVRAARQASFAARATEEQTIRDAANAGVPPTQIARDGLGTKNKGRVYAILGSGPDGGPPAAPALTPVVYLRGAGNSDDTWQEVREAMWARGWATVSDHTTAWHLARGGVPVVSCDFSMDLDETPGNAFGYVLYVLVSQVRARYAKYHETSTVWAQLETADVARLAGRDWVNEEITVTRTDYELVPLNGGKYDRPTRWDSDVPNMGGGKGAPVLDVPALARLVAEAFEAEAPREQAAR